MNQKVARFNGCYKRVQQAHHSGCSGKQILENAHQLYKSENNNSNFLLIDCWRLLKDELKWNTMYQPKGGKRTKVSESGAYTSSSNLDISDDEVRDVRPTGQKNINFRRRFRMRRHVFLCIVQVLENHSEYFQIRFDAVGRRGLSPLQKCIVSMRMLAYGGALVNYVDEYVQIGETTAIKCLVNFFRGVNEIFGTEYLRRPNVGDIRHLLQMGEVSGFPGMLGSIDCMH
ncbi:uncharacterized protein LOC133810302 [Humulus lupulus]|uniref:uncharacterized protein LOC133795585 n=1 Tax=Humulus lupulus TaxID=3486 RepID=UPI002B411BF6|nr:uncharacterized protein LOC133795585 [Humulus lupulus]XP_062102033.1 uncharacterized protein LOC133810302 [Humulus lupulus]